MDPDMEFRYRKLDALDTKCGALLTLTSVMLVVVSLPLFAQPSCEPLDQQTICISLTFPV